MVIHTVLFTFVDWCGWDHSCYSSAIKDSKQLSVSPWHPGVQVSNPTFATKPPATSGGYTYSVGHSVPARTKLDNQCRMLRLEPNACKCSVNNAHSGNIALHFDFWYLESEGFISVRAKHYQKVTFNHAWRASFNSPRTFFTFDRFQDPT